MLSCEEGVIPRSIYLYKINNRSDENELSKFDSLDCHGLVERAKQSGYESVPDKRHQILQGMVKKFNDIQDLKIGSWSFPEILKFEGVSLWQFVTERCYDAYPREIIEIIEYATELIEKFNPEKLRVLGKLKNPQRAVLELIAEHYKKEISFFDISVSANSVEQETDNKLHFVDPAYEKLETGDRFAVRDYIASIQNCVLPSRLSDKVLLVSYPRVWTKNINKVEIDQYYEFFKTFFEEKEWQPIRVDVPYYFTIQGSKKSYIDSCKMREKGGFSTIFFDELYDDEIAQVGEKYRTVFEQKFDYFSRTVEFQAAFSWKGISFFRPLFDFWIYLFVDYLARQCVTSILISRKIIVSLKPKAVFAVGEFGVYARAMIIEAHRANIPSVGLQHGAIHSDSLYYMHKNVSNHPPLDEGFLGFVVATKTLVYGDYHKKVLTTAGYYPEDSVSVLGCDWRLLNVKQECLDKNKLYTLKRKWFSDSKKIALILTGTYNTAIVYRLIERLDPSKYSILVKLHPSDKNEHFYYKIFTENNFDVRVIRDYLYESIEIADLIFTPLCSTVVMDCLALNKAVFYHKEFDLGGTQPWENFTINMLEVDDYDEVNTTKENEIKSHNFLRDLGYDRSMSIKSLNAKLHQVFDEFEDRYFPQNICREDLRDLRDTESADILNADYHRIAESVRIAEEAKKLLGLGGTTGTIPTLKKAIKFTPNYAPAHNNPWAVTFRAREFGQAVGSAEQTYSLGSTNVGANKNLTTAAKEANQVDEAERTYRDALKVLQSDNEICAELETKSVLSSVACEGKAVIADIETNSGTKKEVLRFQNDLYKQLDVNYDNFFHKISENQSPDLNDKPIMHRIKRISFELSNMCNYAYCHKKCPLHGQKEKVVLPSRIVRETIDEVAQIDYDGVFAFHTYSEPLIDPRLFSFITYAKTKCPKSKTLILTNGFYLNQQIADELAELKIWILAVTAYSRSEFNRFSALDVKIPYYVFESKLDDRQNIYDSMPVNIKASCFAPVGDVSVACTGDVVLCCLDWKRRHRFGNLTWESFYSILNKKETLEVYNSLIHGERKLYLCRRCNWVR